MRGCESTIVSKQIILSIRRWSINVTIVIQYPPGVDSSLLIVSISFLLIMLASRYSDRNASEECAANHRWSISNRTLEIAVTARQVSLMYNLTTWVDGVTYGMVVGWDRNYRMRVAG